MEYIILAVIVAVVGYGIYAYNTLVKFRQMVEEAWSGIDVQLKKRSNLIPNLVETVKSYAAHEADTLEEVTNMRTTAGNVRSGDVERRAQAEGLLGVALGRLMAVAEAYPDLKANENFLDLQRSLEDIETEIQMARRYYNGATRNINTMVESFPSNLIANSFGFRKAQYFEIENAAERVVPDVSFKNRDLT